MHDDDGYFGESVAATYDDDEAMCAPEVVDPVFGNPRVQGLNQSPNIVTRKIEFSLEAPLSAQVFHGLDKTSRLGFPPVGQRASIYYPNRGRGEVVLRSSRWLVDLPIGVGDR